MTIFCFGFYTKNKSILSKLKEGWFIEDSVGILIFVPHTLYDTKAINPVIGDGPTNAGKVSLNNVRNVFGIGIEHFQTSEEEKGILQQLSKECDVDISKIDKYAVEYIQTTYDLQLGLNKILPIK